MRGNPALLTAHDAGHPRWVGRVQKSNNLGGIWCDRCDCDTKLMLVL